MLDTNFGVQPVAMSILYALKAKAEESRTFEDARGVETSPLYNGRERGVCVTVRSHGLRTFCVVFGENRNSDDIFVTTFERKLALNPPTCSDIPEEAYKARKYFKPVDVTIAVEHIQTAIRAFLGAENNVAAYVQGKAG
jgi:hypothetical protein